MDKKQIIQKIVQELEREYKTLSQAAKDAHEAATHEESLAENEYDTRGLEASYLAGAQHKRADEVKGLIYIYSHLKPVEFKEGDPIGSTALVKVEVDGETIKWFFLVPHQGGVSVDLDGTTVQSISLDSPVGREMKGQSVGHSFVIKTRDHEVEYEIIEVQ